MKIYLAGGLRTDWQSAVMDSVDAQWLDPREANVDGPSLSEVAKLEMDWLRECDVVFAYLESSNPSGLGLATEVGFAHALNKVVILVDEQDSRYSAFVRCFSDHVTDKLWHGTQLLRQLIKDKE